MDRPSPNEYLIHFYRPNGGDEGAGGTGYGEKENGNIFGKRGKAPAEGNETDGNGAASKTLIQPAVEGCDRCERCGLRWSLKNIL